jgi:hypothetical protein
MANKKVCSVAFQQALQDKLGYSSTEIDKLRSEYFKTVKNVQANFEQFKVGDAYNEAVKQMMDIRKIRNINKRRQSYKNLTRRLEMEKFIYDGFGDNYERGVNKFLELVHYSKEAKSSSYLADFQRRLLGRDGFGEDYSSFLTSGKYDGLIYKELYYLDNAEATARDKHLQHKDGSFTGDPIAKRLADILHKVQRVAVQDAIDAGADIALIPGYMARQSHSAEKFLHKKFGNTELEKKEHWKQTILEHIDQEKTFGSLPADVSIDQVLDNIWKNITSGSHFSYIPEEMSFIPGRNVARKAGLERKLFFKDGAHTHEYMKIYGQDNLREAVLFQLENMANTTTLLNYMGTNPRYNFENVVRNLQQRAHEEANVKNLEYFKKGSGMNVLPDSANNALASLLGEDRRPGSLSFAKVNAVIRSMNNVAFLGGSLITSLMDLASSPIIGHLQGRDYMNSYTSALRTLVGEAKDPVVHDVLDSIGFVNDAILGQIAEKFSGDVGLSRQAGYITNKFFQMNGLRWWTDSVRAGHTLGMSRDMARKSHLSFKELNINTQEYFKRFGITEQDWDILRTHAVKEAINGDKFMLNEAIEKLSDKEIADIYGIVMEATNNVKDASGLARAARIHKMVINNARTKLAEKLRTALLAAGMESALLPTNTEKGFAYQNTRPGTLKGEAFRHFSQFKQFPYAMYNIVLKGIANEARIAGPMEAVKTGALLMTGMIMTAYVSMSIKDALNNRTPRDLSDPKTLAEVVVRSGALSVYGDLLFNDFSRSPYEALGVFAGPTISGAAELASVASKAVWKGQNISDDLAKFGMDRIPAAGVLSPATSALAYTNLFYLKPILNYYIFNNINEMLNPGCTERTRARLLKQGRDYLIDPQN